ncbi:MAG TPA: molecular chaperone DnaJ, partial [Cellvibrionaceae bacterium]|nr:molecular chaperone DnaJ [Cellvibrionaceae bacterium]
LTSKQKDLLRQLQEDMTGSSTHSPKQSSWFEGMKNFFGDMKL